MPVSLTALLSGNQKVEIPYGKDTLNVWYDPRFYTYEQEEKLNAVIEEERGSGTSKGAKMSITRFLGLVKTWDLVDEKGKPVPLTEDGLRRVPRLALDEIYLKVLADLAVPKEPSSV